MTKARIYYWDSSVFIQLLSDQDGADNVQHFLDEAEQEEVVIVVSSITPVEVVKLKGEKPIAKKDRDTIRRFFQKDYFKWVDCTRRVGERAQDLIWDHPGLWPYDALHLASAIEFEKISGRALDAIHSYDAHFLRLNGQLPIVAHVVEPIPSQSVMRKLLAQAKAAKPKAMICESTTTAATPPKAQPDSN
jgi:predicted nucleic acid-binding protein